MDPFGFHSDGSLGKRARNAADKEKVQEDSSRDQINIDRAIDLMRFVFKEGMAFLDNGSGRSYHERYIVDMSGYMVNQIFQGPGASRRDGPSRMWPKTPTLENAIAHAFAKETRKCVANELQGDFFGIHVDVCSPRSTHKTYMVLFIRYLNGMGEVTERLLGVVPDPAVRHPALKAAVGLMLSEAGLSWSNVRGQGYGLLGYDHECITEPMASILKENASAYYVHPHLCQLHSTLISASYGVTTELSLALVKEDLEAENCMTLLQESKNKLQVMRNEGFTSFLSRVNLLCRANDIPMPNMGHIFKHRCRLLDKDAKTMTNLEHYRVDFFENVINIHLNELNMRFGEQSSALVLLSSCLNPRNSFQAFDKDKLIEYARFYPSDLSESDITALNLQLQSFATDMRSDIRFREVNTLGALSMKMMEIGKNAVYPLVYLLLKLALILPGTLTAKTASSAMKFIDSTITEEPCNQWFCDCLLLFLENGVLENISNDAVIASL
ncbi:hypothetical protein QOZ80_3BG0279300 [Eleusine coracana subsp. coracana]|nr:hypothetical protein QOZ80_3BG0279300 [Eleusine coracana subsp. coracana]